jgi:hypothetical protein
MLSKQMTIAALLGAVSATQLKDLQTAELIVKGLLFGALDAEGFDDIEKCITDGVTIVKDAETAVEDFEKKDISDVIDGLKMIADILKTTKDAMSDCASIKADWAKLEQMASIFASPTSLAYHIGKDLVINGKDIFKEVNTAVQDYETDQWEDFGYNLGEAAAKLILGDNSIAPAQEKEDLGKFMQGIINTFGGHFDLTALLICINEEDQAAMLFYQAFEVFKEAIHDKDPVEAFVGALMAVGGLKQAEQGLPACEAIDTKSWDFDGLVKSTKFFSNPKNLRNHKGAIVRDAEKVIAAYEQRDWVKAGENFGQILKFTTSADDTMKQAFGQFLMGITKQFGGHFDLTALLICINEEDQALMLFYEAFQVFREAIKDKDPIEAIAGALMAVGGLKQAEQGLPACEAIDTKSWDF